MLKDSWIKNIRLHYNLYVMIAPVFIGFTIFHYVPMYGLLIAFQDYDFVKGILGSEWVGLKHFIHFVEDPYFLRVLKNTFLLSLYGLLWGFWPPILLALLLNELKLHRFKKITQSISYLPHFLASVVLVGFVFELLASQGIVNQTIASLGLEPVNFFTDPSWFRTIYISTTIWQGIGWGSIIYLAALTGVSPELYQSAIIDGATRFQQAIHITIPTIMPTIRLLLIFSVSSVLSVGFELVYLLYNPAIYQTADVIATYVYRRGILGFDYSFGAAISFAHSVVSIVLLLIAHLISKKVSGEGIW